eukprot:IDg3972t1
MAVKFLLFIALAIASASYSTTSPYAVCEKSC